MEMVLCLVECNTGEESFTKDAGIDKVNEAEVLQEVVLDRCPGDEHSPLGAHGVQGLVRLVVRVLKSMTLWRKHRGINHNIQTAV